jgi:uncharacterized delta-60 repeat protein
MARKRCSRRPEIKISCLVAGNACIALIVFTQAAFAREGQGYGKSVAVQTDGKIVVAGYGGVGRADQVLVVRYNADGTLDTSFNGSGKIISAVGDGDCKGEGLALQNDGKIVVAGYSFTSGRSEFTVVRYNADGTLDPGFGESGKVMTEIGRNSDSANSVALQRDGKIVVVGYMFFPGNNDFAVARYNANGALDTTFNGTGKAAADFSKLDYGRSVAVQSDGKVVVAGDAANGESRTFAVARFNANGTPDISFNKTGKLTTDFGGGNAEARGVAVQSDGKIVVAGVASVDGTEKFALVRYNPDGTLDTSFGGSGKILTLVGMSGSNATSMALQSDGKIVVAGYAINNSGRGRDFAIVRYDADGNLDTSFNGSGKVTTAVSDDDGHCEAVAVEKDGKIVAAGWASNGEDNNFAVVRLTTDGKLDSTFNNTGKTTTAVGSNELEDQGKTPTKTKTALSMATINDPDGYTNVRDRDNKVIAKVKAGERFIAEQPTTESKQWQVYLKSGIEGLMDRSRIRLLPDEPLMKFNYDASKKEWRKLQSEKAAEDGEAASAAKGHGVDYYKTLVRASEGNLQALARIFALAQFMDGGAAESYFPDTWALFHVVGDKRFAEFLRREPLAKQLDARGVIASGTGERMDYPEYFQHNFPETTKILYRREIVDWNSPDGRYAIRKTFANPLDLTDSKVIHAELIEKKSGKLLCDLTAEDIGVGSDREGTVLWSPDSKRFAYVSSDKTIHAGSLFSNPPVTPQKTQTTVYQLSGNSCAKVDLQLNQPPGQESDREIISSALGHDFVTPTRWENPNTLILEKHDYYETLMPSSGMIHGLARLYEITVSFKEDGSASTSWKLQEDR